MGVILSKINNFDEFPKDIPQFWTEYEKKKIAGKEYPVNWKSLQSMRTDQVKILIKVENPDSIDTRLSIESNISGQLNFTLSTEKNADTVRLLTLTGLTHESEEQITAYYTQDDGTKIAVGYLNTISYDAQNKKLILVPVENEFKPNETDIENYLQNTYKSAVTFWDISLSDPLYVDFERNETKGLDTDLPGVAAYTKEPFMQPIK